MNILKNYKLWVAFFLGLYMIIGFFVVPNIALKQINKFTQNNFEQKIMIDDVGFNPFTFSATIYNLNIQDPKTNQNLISILELSANLDILNLLTNEINLDEIEIFHPQFNIELFKDGSLNLAQIQLKNSNKKDTKETTQSSLPIISIDELLLDNATINFTDNTLEEPFKTTISDFSYTFYDLSTQANSLAAHRLSLTIDEETSLDIDGGLYINPLLIYGNVKLNNFQTKLPLAYIKDKLNFHLPNSSIDTDFGFVANLHDIKNPRVLIEAANVHFGPLQIEHKKTKEVLTKFNSFDISDLYFDLNKQKLTIGVVSFDSLYANAKLQNDGQINLIQQFVPNTQNETQKEEKTSEALDLLIHDIVLQNSSIDFQDQKENFQTKVENINFLLNDFTLNQNDQFDFSLSLQTLEHAKIQKSGTLSILPLKINSQFSIEDFHVNKLSPYYNDIVNFKIQNATFATNGDFTFDSTTNNNIQFSNTNLSLNNLQIVSNDKKILALDQFQTNTLNFDLNQQNISIDSVLLDKFYSNIELNKNKEVNVANLIKKSNSKDTKQESKPWNLNIASTKIKNSTIDFEDNSLEKPFKTQIASINTTLKNLTLSPDKKAPFSIDLLLNKKGKVNLNGELTLNPLKINTKYKVSALWLPFIQPYIQEHLNLDLRKATLYTSGSFYYQERYNYFNLYSYISLYNLLLEHDITNKELLKLKKLQVKAINLKKNSLKIKSINIEEPTLTANIYEDATTNFKEIIKGSQKESDEQKEEKVQDKKPSTFMYDIGPVTVSNGFMHFSDATLPFYFATDIHDLNGNISQLNSDISKPSIIELQGQIDEYGLANIKGETTTSDWTNNTDFTLYFKNISMKNYTPYSGKFVGRKLEGGSLNLDLNYNIKDSQLNAQNSIMLERIQLGDTVESEDASNLPLELAIALLEDSNGIIDIDLPITGDVNDPQFSIGHIVWKAVGKLIISIVASPFKLLGALIGVDQEQLSHVIFEPGQSILVAPAKQSLDQMIQALQKRPNLSLVLQPAFAKDIDKYALQEAVLDTYLQKELEEDIHDKDDVMDELEDLYEDFLDEDKLEQIEESFIKIVKHEKTGKEVEQFDQDGYIAKMKDDLIRIQVLDENALQQLAKQRTQEIKNYLFEKAIPAQRIVEKPEILEVESKDIKWADYKLDVQINKEEKPL